MKKLSYLTMIVVALGFIFSGCEEPWMPEGAKSEKTSLPGRDGPMLSIPSGVCGEPTVVDLIAGQNETVGTVTVANDGGNLYVEYDITADGWSLTETHLHVAASLEDIPQTKKGNPIPGKFDYKAEHDPAVTEYTYTIPLSDIEGAPYYASSVVDYEQKKRKDGSDVLPERSDPDAALTKGESFFALGFGGWIIVEFAYPIHNGAGNDLCIWEVTGGSYPLEATDVSVSQDNVNWTLLGTADNDTPPAKEGDRTRSEFDLGGLAWARYIKIVDVCNPGPFSNDADGFDLDGVSSLQNPKLYIAAHAVVKGKKTETAWGDGEDFEGKNWATYFTYTWQSCP